MVNGLGCNQRIERVSKVQITCICEIKQGRGSVDFVDTNGKKRFAEFTTEVYDEDNDMWAGKDSELYEALQKAFTTNAVVNLIVARVGNDTDVIINVEAVV
jgi:hypothetical protein